MHRLVWIILCGLLAFASGDRSYAAGGLRGAGANWSVHGGDSDETGYSRLDAINTTNVGQLGLAWSLDLPGETTLEATSLAVNGVLYFTGSYAAVYAVDATNGKLLWKYDPETWKYNPGTWRLDFAVSRGVAYADGRLYGASHDGLTFALDGHAPLETAAPDDTVHVVDDPSIKIDPKAAAAGEALFHPCLLCHGANLVSPGGPGPDLRESQLALDPESFWKVVHDGASASNGMPPFENLTRQQVMQLYAYVRAGARKVLPGGTPWVRSDASVE